jgi:hypothetical protein
MPRHCSTCASPRLAEISKDLARNSASLRDLAARYGLTPSSLQRHRANCLLEGKHARRGRKNLTPEGIKPKKRIESDGRCPTCDQMTGEGNAALTPEQIIKRAERVLYLSEKIAAKAESNDDARLALSAVDRCQRALEGLMKATGLIGADVQVNIDNRQQNAYVSWPSASLEALSTMHECLSQGFTVQAAIEAVMGNEKAPALPRPEGEPEAA